MLTMLCVSKTEGQPQKSFGQVPNDDREIDSAVYSNLLVTARSFLPYESSLQDEEATEKVFFSSSL